MIEMFSFWVGVLLVLSVVDRNATSPQKYMDLSKQNASTVFSHSVKWLISSSWITLACQYMYASLHLFLGRLFWVDLIKWVSNVHPSICTSVRPSTKSFFDFHEIWHVGRGRWVMHDSMQYDWIQGQGHEPFKVGNSSIFKCYLLCHLQWELATDHWFLNQGTISKLTAERSLAVSSCWMCKWIGTVQLNWSIVLSLKSRLKWSASRLWPTQQPGFELPLGVHWVVLHCAVNLWKWGLVSSDMWM